MSSCLNIRPLGSIPVSDSLSFPDIYQDLSQVGCRSPVVPGVHVMGPVGLVRARRLPVASPSTPEARRLLMARPDTPEGQRMPVAPPNTPEAARGRPVVYRTDRDEPGGTFILTLAIIIILLILSFILARAICW